MEVVVQDQLVGGEHVSRRWNTRQLDDLDIELLTIKLRLLIASVDKAKEMGIDWWERDERLSGPSSLNGGTRDESLEERVGRLEQAAGLGEAQHAVERK